MKDKDTNINIRNVPSELARQVKSQAALRGQTIRQYVLEVLKKAVAGKS